MTKEEKQELDFLRYMYQTIDFGPAHEDVMALYELQYTKRTGNPLPPGYGPQPEE